ncbi:hypothetical protein FA13DRAFT_1723778 [Coprinellus micaceus]|uniref:Uncharacterized protein n=1 Tax=Coprinellus micaceus TaxID=71717 RepID=A0A4Y7TZF0_COPMI|nr:hypothetical protein FA13DRAFT_1723778 [Coprinellus micaceus]
MKEEGAAKSGWNWLRAERINLDCGVGVLLLDANWVPILDLPGGLHGKAGWLRCGCEQPKVGHTSCRVGYSEWLWKVI